MVILSHSLGLHIKEHTYQKEQQLTSHVNQLICYFSSGFYMRITHRCYLHFICSSSDGRFFWPIIVHKIFIHDIPFCEHIFFNVQLRTTYSFIAFRQVQSTVYFKFIQSMVCLQRFLLGHQNKKVPTMNQNYERSGWIHSENDYFVQSNMVLLPIFIS